MRIITGIYKGRILKKPAKIISPTKDSVKETIFNILRNRVKGGVVLDLFSGTGALGLEAFSRGAERVFLVDKDTLTINKNLKALNIDIHKEIKVFRQDVFYFIEKIAEKGVKFDIVFLDPPYHDNMTKKCLHMLSSYDILHPECLIVAEHYTRNELPQLIERLKLMRKLIFGQTSISIYQKE